MRKQELMMRAISCVDADLVEEAEKYTVHKKSRLCVVILVAACIGVFSVGTVFAVGWIAGNYRDYHCPRWTRDNTVFQGILGCWQTCCPLPTEGTFTTETSKLNKKLDK